MSEPGPFISGSGRYHFGTVAADDGRCSKIGMEIMASGGSAVDAAIATVVGLGVVNAQHVGIGGGSIMVIHARPKTAGEMEFVTINGRESAPLTANPNMFDDDPPARITGPRSMAVPGEMRGLHAAWKRYGRLEWKTLLEPSIKMCNQGWKVSNSMAVSIEKEKEAIAQDAGLRETYLKSDGSPYKEGELIKDPKLGVTLQKIADNGPDILYTGSLADDMLADIHDLGGALTKDDLDSNKPIATDTIKVHLKTGNFTLHVAPPPSSGVAVANIMKIMDGYGYTPGDFEEEGDQILFYRRALAAFGFGLLLLPLAMGDITHASKATKEWVKRAVDDAYAEQLRGMINGDKLIDIREVPIAVDGGTSGLAVLAPDGAAVSLTSTLGKLFGCKHRGKRTGIIFNNGLQLLAPKSLSNTLGPYRRGGSTVSPLMVTNEAGKVVFIAAASGGRRIITSTSLVTMMNLWLGKSLSDAVDMPRLHYEKGQYYYDDEFQQSVLDGLQSKAHVKFQPKSPSFPYLGVVQAISAPGWDSCPAPSCAGCIEAVCDWRKGGYPDGH